MDNLLYALLSPHPRLVQWACASTRHYFIVNRLFASKTGQCSQILPLSFRKLPYLYRSRVTHLIYQSCTYDPNDTHSRSFHSKFEIIRTHITADSLFVQNLVSNGLGSARLFYLRSRNTICIIKVLLVGMLCFLETPRVSKVPVMQTDKAIWRHTSEGVIQRTRRGSQQDVTPCLTR